MRSKLFRNWQLAVVLAGLPFLMGSSQPSSDDASTQNSTSLVTPAAIPPDTNAPAIPAEAPAVATDTVQAPAVSTIPPTPDAAPPAPNIRLSSGAAQVVELAQSGVDESVMLAFVSSSATHFGLGFDQIIYLNDLGISGTVVKAMIDRDLSLTQAAAIAAAQAAAQVPQPAPTDTTPPPATVDTSAPAMPGNGPAPYPPPAETVDQPIPSNPNDDMTDDSGANPDNYYAGSDGSDYFFGALAPYGNWIYVAGYGRCWQPTVCVVNHDWRPYCDRGRWLNSDCGWYWHSDYSWGWAAFHYGRWFNSGQGWVWQPGRTWGPAWVSWRYSPAYCGWAPLPPAARFAPGVGLAFGSHAVTASFEFGLQASQYTFVPVNHFADAVPARYRVPTPQIGAFYQQTTVNNSITVQNHKVINHGIDPLEVAAVSHTEIQQVEIRDQPAAAGGTVRPDRVTRTGGAAVIYRPSIAHVASSGALTPANGGSQSGAYPRNSLAALGNNQGSRPLPNMNLAHQPSRTETAYYPASMQPGLPQPPVQYSTTARAYQNSVTTPHSLNVYQPESYPAAAAQPQWIAPNRISRTTYSYPPAQWNAQTPQPYPPNQWNIPVRAPQAVVPSGERYEPNTPSVPAPPVYRAEPAPVYRAPVAESRSSSSTSSSSQSSSWSTSSGHH